MAGLPDNGGHGPASQRGPLRDLGTDVAGKIVASSIVERLDVIEDICPHQIADFSSPFLVIRSLLRLLKKDSFTAISRQFTERPRSTICRTASSLNSGV